MWGGGGCFFLPPGTKPWRQTRGGVRKTGMKGHREEEQDSTCPK